MYMMNDRQTFRMPDELGMFPVVYARVTPAWMSAEHYENCDSNLLCRIRSHLRRKA